MWKPLLYSSQKLYEKVKGKLSCSSKQAVIFLTKWNGKKPGSE